MYNHGLKSKEVWDKGMRKVGSMWGPEGLRNRKR